MFKKFAAFWIENAKLTWLFVGATLMIGVFSWFTIAKQYNPDIVVPAFQITVPAPGFSSQQTQQLVTKPLENIVSGLEGIDHVYGYSANNMASVLVAFHVGVDKEKATTRLHNAITANQSRVPLGVNAWDIQSIDPDDIPIFSFAIIKESGEFSPEASEQGVENEENKQQNATDRESGSFGVKCKTATCKNSADLMKLRTIALEVIDELKVVKNTTLWFHQGGQREQLNVEFDMDALQSKQIDVLQVIQALQAQQRNQPIGSVKLGDTEAVVALDASQDSLASLQQIVVANYQGRQIYLEDVARIHRGKNNFVPVAWWGDGDILHEAIFVGVAKKKGSNAVNVAKAVQKELEYISQKLPVGFSIKIIQNEGKVAARTTNMLLINLAQSILIVLIILSLFLGRTQALNVAITIPLTLSVVFVFILIMGDNINRITLFALILVLGMLVDNATVVVENVSRHLSLRTKTNKSMKETILDAIGEVELGVVLSTITRLLAFISMFFVTGMMGDYMGPIPKYAIVTMMTSMIIALSINPFLAYFFESQTLIPNPSAKRRGTSLLTKLGLLRESLGSRFKKKWDAFGERYMMWLKMYLAPHAVTKRKKFKRVFWIILGICVVIPIYFEVFKVRMLPKSDQQQIYLWMDLARDSNVEKSKEVVRGVQGFLNGYYTEMKGVKSGKPQAINNEGLEVNKKYQIIENTSRWVGTAPMVDFPNLFRGSQSRGLPYQVSARINLIGQGERSLSSEEFVFALREKLGLFLEETYPDVEMRLLEDPPGPPTRATFLLEIASNEMSYETLLSETQWLQQKLTPVLDAYEMKDIGMSDDGRQTEYSVQLDHQLLAHAGLTAEQVGMTLGALYHGMDVALVYDDVHLEPITIYVRGDEEQLGSEKAFARILLTNSIGQRIPLTEVATIVPQQHDQSIYSDDRMQTVYMYGEMGNNSVIYPILGLYKMFKKDSFREGKYEYLGGDFYGFDLQHKLSGQKLRINLGGEWELTMDTFRDMGLAMMIAFLAIYIMMVIQFGRFSLAGVIMISFLLGFFGVFPGYALLYLRGGEYFSATSMIGVIALAGIVVGNAILLIEYVIILLKRGNTVKMALVAAGWTRMKPILITSLTTILGATTILGDPVWSGVAWAIILGLSTSAVLTTVVLPIFLYDGLVEQQEDYDLKEERISIQETN